MTKPYFSSIDSIKKTLVFDNRTEKIDNDFPIAFGMDRQFFIGAVVAIASIIKENKTKKLTFHLFTDHLLEQDIEKLKELSETHKIKLSLYFINTSLSGLPTTKNWTIAIYYRFIIFDYFVGKYEKVLYLDSDIVCTNSMDEIINYNLSTHIAAVVSDADESWWIKQANKLHCSEIKNGYFNSGVLLVNLPVWHDADISFKAINMLKDKKLLECISYPDQDVLNILLAGNLLFLEKKYNTQISLNYELKKDFKYIKDDDVIFLHYIGPTKPWHDWGSYLSAKPFLDSKKISSWADEPLMLANTATQCRYAAKHYFHQNKNIKAILSWFKYYILKLKT